MKASDVKNPSQMMQAQEDLLVGIGSQGVAALAVLRNLMRALKAKGVFSEIELAAIFDASCDLAKGSGDQSSERFAEAVRTAIRGLEGSVLPSPSAQKH